MAPSRAGKVVDKCQRGSGGQGIRRPVCRRVFDQCAEEGRAGRRELPGIPDEILVPEAGFGAAETLDTQLPPVRAGTE